MKKWVILIGIVVLVLIGGYFGLCFYGVKLIQPQLQKLLGPGFTLTEIKIKLTYLSIRGIQYEGLHTKKRYLQVEEVKIYPSILTLFKGPLRIREFSVLRPSFFLYRTPEGIFVGPWTATVKKEEKEVSDDQKQKEGEPIFIKIDRLHIQQGSVDFEDRKGGRPPERIKLRGLDLDIRDIHYPILSVRSFVELRGKVEGKAKEGDIESKGWIDLKTMDMETSFKVREIDLKIFEPYYRKRVSAEIDSGYMNMDTRISIREKMINAPGTLELTDLHMKEDGTVFWIPAKVLTPLLKDRGGHIQIQFHMKGNMDDPQFKLQETFLTRVAISFAEALGIPVKVVGEEILERTIKGEKGMVEELRYLERHLRKKRNLGVRHK